MECSAWSVNAWNTPLKLAPIAIWAILGKIRHPCRQSIPHKIGFSRVFARCLPKTPLKLADFITQKNDQTDQNVSVWDPLEGGLAGGVPCGGGG